MNAFEKLKQSFNEMEKAVKNGDRISISKVESLQAMKESINACRKEDAEKAAKKFYRDLGGYKYDEFSEEVKRKFVKRVNEWYNNNIEEL